MSKRNEMQWHPFVRLFVSLKCPGHYKGRPAIFVCGKPPFLPQRCNTSKKEISYFSYHALSHHPKVPIRYNLHGQSCLSLHIIYTPQLPLGPQTLITHIICFIGAPERKIVSILKSMTLSLREKHERSEKDSRKKSEQTDLREFAEDTRTTLMWVSWWQLECLDNFHEAKNWPLFSLSYTNGL